MIHTDDRRTLDERYGRATQSDRLLVLEARVTDVDYLVSAGWCKEGLGTSLFRLRCEWDLAAGDVRLAARHLAAAEQALREAAARAKKARSDEQADAIVADARDRVVQARGAALTARAVAMVYLTTLDDAKTRLGGYAEAHAIRERYNVSAASVIKCAGAALRYWLDSACHACQGRGFHGGHLVPKTLCSACHGSRRSDGHLRGECLDMPAAQKTSSATAFTLSLLSEMDRKCHVVERAMLRYLRSRHMQRAHADVDAAAVALRGRLAELRSARAQED